MIVAHIQDSIQYYALHPALKILFEYISSHNLLELPNGRIEIDGDKLFINNDTPSLLKADEQVLEVHRRYIDVHLPLDGKEIIGWKATRDCCKMRDMYDEEKDRMFYTDHPTAYVELNPGEFCICFPEDAHAPIIGTGSIHKAVAKILLK